jgi:pyrroloquinoline-quinone synthase
MSVPENARLDEIDALVAQRSLLLHPFYQSWAQGGLHEDALADYAKQYYHHVAAFPTYLSALHAHTEDADTRRGILANLIDEEAGNPNHPELWLRFAEGLGVKRETVIRAELAPETKNLILTFRSACRDRSTAEGLAALYAYESQIPSVAESKIAGLRNYYGIDSPDVLAYFNVHIEADRIHSEAERHLLSSHVNGANATSVMQSVREILDALWEMLSGVCRRHAVAC